MKEATIAFIWKHLLFDFKNLKTTNGQTIEIVNVGVENDNAGPDFSNAKIRVDKTLWIGNIEIHINSSDWFKHHHHLDQKYQNVILHIVFNYDKPVYDMHNNEIPCIALNKRIPKDILYRTEMLSVNEQVIACNKLLENINDFEWMMWKENLLVQRIEDKTQQVKQLLNQFNNDWEMVFFVFLARAFGLKINSNAMGVLAMKTSIKLIQKIGNNPMKLEAYLFGQAGFLDQKNEENNPYFEQLKKEYLFLKHKYQLESIDFKLWNFLRLRPSSFPTIRIAQLANLLFQKPNFLQTILNAEKCTDLKKILACKASPFWDNRYTFNKSSEKKYVKKLGQSTINSIIINAICPIIYVYGKAQFQEDYCEKSLSWMAALKPEKNRIITKWAALNIKAENAGESQGLIHLYNNFCKQKKCLNCRVGQLIIKG